MEFLEHLAPLISAISALIVAIVSAVKSRDPANPPPRSGNFKKMQTIKFYSLILTAVRTAISSITD
jgi:hypothetical protein